jgi:hypothetical protein
MRRFDAGTLVPFDTGKSCEAPAVLRRTDGASGNYIEPSFDKQSLVRSPNTFCVDGHLCKNRLQKPAGRT